MDQVAPVPEVIDHGVRPARSRAWIVALALLALATIAVYAPTFHYPFINYDDPEYVADNPIVRQGLTAQGVNWALVTGTLGNWHPLTWTSYMLDVSLFGPNPGAIHAVNVAIHLANALLLAWLLHRMTGSIWRSLIVAGVFALHPAHVESVAWISERKDVLSTLFLLAALHAYVSYARTRSMAAYFASAIALAAGLMSKPTLVSTPILMLLLDAWPLGRLAHWRDLQSRIVEKIPMIAMCLLSASITLSAQRGGGAVVSLERMSVATRSANAIVSYARYLGKTVWPTNLAIFYPQPDGWSAIAVAGALTLFVAITAIAIAQFRRRTYVLVGWLWFVIALVPVIGLMQVGGQSIADRYTYLPLIGIFVAVVWGMADLMPATGQFRVVAGVVATALLVASAAATSRQVHYWRDSETLFAHAIDVTRGNWLAHNQVATTLIAQGRLEGALAHARQAVAIKPESSRPHFTLGDVYAAMGDRENALGEYRRVTETDPNMPQAWNNAGVALAQLGRLDDAKQYFEHAIRCDPNYDDAKRNLEQISR